MRRINLQLFALKLNTDTSIVDYLKSKGQNSSYESRRKLAGQNGISNYTGTAEQNTRLLQTLKNKNGSTATSAINTAAGSNGAQKNIGKAAASGVVNAAIQAASKVLEGQNSAPAGVEAGVNNGGTVEETGQAVVENKEVVSGFQPKQYETPVFTPTKTPVYKGQTTQSQQAAALDQRLPADTLAALNSQFQVSQAYQQAMEYTNGLLQQLSGGKTTYSDQISQLIKDYQSREKFAYDADSDPLFQQALASAMRSGKTAMQDTMGQAAALTGGYGSTYATNAGQSAYNQYLQEAYDMLPEYYQLAMEAYNMESEAMLSQISLLDSADSKEYERLANAYNANYNNAQNQYSQEYAAWQDRVNNAYNYAGLMSSDYWNQMDYEESVRQYDQNFQYQQYQDKLAQTNWQNQFEYQQYMDQLAQNQWQSEFDYQQYLDALSQSNYEKEFEYQKEQDALSQQNWQDSFDYQKEQDSLAQDNYLGEFAYQKEQDKQAQSNYEKEFAYQQEQDKQSQSNYEQEFDYQKQQDSLSQSNWEKEYAQMIEEYYQSLEEEKRQFNESMAEEQRQYDSSLAEDKRQFDESLGFDREMAAQEQANYERELAIQESQTQAEAELGEPEEGYAALTDTNINNVKEVFLQAGGGDAGYAAVDQYLTAIGKNNVDNENLLTMLNGLEIPLQYQDWIIETDTTNWLGGNDNNDTYTYAGETSTYKELRERIEELDISELEKEELLRKLKAQSKK